MLLRIFWPPLLGAVVFGASARAQTADQPAPPAATSAAAGIAALLTRSLGADSSRNYTTQALRFESSWGSADIIRGAKGEVVGTVGWFRDFDVEKLLQSSPQAAAAAQDFRVSNFRGSVVSTIGASLLALGVIVASNSSNNASSPILIIAGAGGVGWGLQHITASYSALSRALWWYNRDLAR